MLKSNFCCCGKNNSVIYQAHETKTNPFFFFTPCFAFLFAFTTPFFYSSLCYIPNMSTQQNADLERNYHSITSVATSRERGLETERAPYTVVLQHQTMRHQRQRVILFAILVTISMTFVFISYLVSAVSKPTCSDRIVWIPNCNREEY